MKINQSLFLSLLVLPLVSCSSAPQRRNSFYFDTFVDSQVFKGDESDLDELDKIFAKVDKLADNYSARNLNNIYSLNHTNEIIEIDETLYDILKKSFSTEINSLNYFNPLCGSLSKKWKESLAKGEVLSNEVIDVELAKMASSSLTFLDNNRVQRLGEAEIDLGAIAKGYVLDLAKSYLDSKNLSEYLINAGSSSILLGEKSGGKNFVVQISDLSNSYLNLKNCFVSTSSFARQGVSINNQIYSHIINPINGSAISEHDAVIVVSQSGYLGDILSTAFINESIDSIKVLEKQFNVKSIVIKDQNIVYLNNELEINHK